MNYVGNFEMENKICVDKTMVKYTGKYSPIR